MVSLEYFFGLVIDDERADIIWLMDLLGVRKEIEETKVVKSLAQKIGRSAPIVAVARRQQTLKLLKPLLDQAMLEHDPNYYSKEINTSSQHDRQYGAEEHLLEYALIVATTKSKKMMSADGKYLTVKQLREAVFKGSRFEKFWEILSQETDNIVKAFRKV